TVTITSNGGAFGTTDAPPGSFGGSNADPASDFNIVRLNTQEGTTQINVNGVEDIQLRTANTTTSAVTGVNAATLSGALDMTANYNSGESFLGLKVSTAGATITGGSGDDFLAGNSGTDTFDLSHGGHDTVDFLHQTDSPALGGHGDVINGFVSGND